MKKTEMLSSTLDCYLLAIYLKQQLKDKISYFGSINQETISGKYFSPYKKRYNTNFFFDNGLPFCFKYQQDDFLRIQIGSSIPTETSMGEKLAALSTFYEVLEKIFDEPTVFYILENKAEETISLQWFFKNKEEDIMDLQSNTYFDEQMTKLIVFNQDAQDYHYQLVKKAKENISRRIGLPHEMSSLISENFTDYVKYKDNKVFQSSNVKEDSFQKRKISKKLSY